MYALVLPITAAVLGRMPPVLQAHSVLYATLSAHQELDTSLPQGLLYPTEGHPDHFLLNALSVGPQAGRMIGDSLGNGASYWVRENPP